MKNIRRTISDYAMIFLGSTIVAFGLTLFTNPAKIAPGGVSGIATILYHIFSWDLSMLILIQNIPLFILGVAVFGKRYGARTLTGIFVLSIATKVFSSIFGFEGILDYSEDMSYWLSCLYGGVISGLGMGIVMKSGSNTGGTDILAQVIAKYTHISLGTCLFFVDAVIIAFSALTFGIQSALYAVIVAYITNIVVDKVMLLMGTTKGITLFIITGRIEEIRDYILDVLQKSGTLIEAKGLYSLERKPMLMVVVAPDQINKIYRAVHEIDKDAFVIINETYNVLGEGFGSLESASLDSDVTKS